MSDLEDNLLLFFTGFSRRAGDILYDQHIRTQKNDPIMLEQLHEVKASGSHCAAALQSGQLALWGTLMHDHWMRKKQRSNGMSSEKIDAWYQIGLNNGALGGKLVGAGGGGFLMFYASDPMRLRQAMTKIGLEEVKFQFDFEGTKLVIA